MPDLPHGFTSRHLNPADDVAGVVDLCNAATVPEYGVPDVDERLICESYQIPGSQAERDSLLVLDPAGQPAGLAEFYDTEVEHASPFLFIRVRPEHLDSTVPDRWLAWGALCSSQRIGQPDLGWISTLGGWDALESRGRLQPGFVNRRLWVRLPPSAPTHAAMRHWRLT